MEESRKPTPQLTVSVQPEDFLAYNLLGSSFTFISFLVYLVLLMIVLTVIGYYDMSTPQKALASLAQPTGLFLLMAGVYYGYVRWRSLRYYRATPEIASEVLYEIREKGLSVGRGKGQRTVKWEEFHRVMGNRRVLALFTSRTNAFILPWAVLEQAGGEERILELIRQQVPKRRVRLPRSRRR